MSNYYEILGVAKDATAEQIKKAFKKLASKFHPDKHTDASDEEKATAEAKFKEAKEAYEILTDDHKRKIYDMGGDPNGHSGSGWQETNPSEMEEILAAMRAARGGFAGGFQQGFRQVTEFQAGVTLRKAFEGFTVNINMPDGSSKPIRVPAGTPEGFRSQHDVTPNLTVIAITRIHDPHFRVKNAAECSWHKEAIEGKQCVVIETGDIETTVKVDALDILLGTWVKVPGIQDEDLQVRVPGGFNLEQRLRIKGKGYYHWVHELSKPGSRGDLYVKIEPVFKSLKDIPIAKLEELISTASTLQGVKPGSKVDTKA